MNRREFCKTWVYLSVGIVVGMFGMKRKYAKDNPIKPEFEPRQRPVFGSLEEESDRATVRRLDGGEFVEVMLGDLKPGDVFTISTSDGVHQATSNPYDAEEKFPDGTFVTSIKSRRLDK